MSQIIKGTVSGAQNVRGTIKEIPHLDKTLTKEGYAADAKAVGVALENKAPISHTEDKNNPHGVTASQVGARPDTWMPSASEIGAAPAGYGLGGYAKILTSADNLDNITENGYYAWSEIPQGFNGGGFVMHVVNMTENWLVQEITDLVGYSNTKQIRQRLNGVWQPWEWLNPPMTVGSEYLTIERYKGKPVYVKAVTLDLNADGYKSVLVCSGLTGVKSFDWYVLDNGIYPSDPLSYGEISSAYMEHSTGYFKVVSSALSGKVAHAIVKYTK